MAAGLYGSSIMIEGGFTEHLYNSLHSGSVSNDDKITDFATAIARYTPSMSYINQVKERARKIADEQNAYVKWLDNPSEQGSATKPSPDKLAKRAHQRTTKREALESSHGVSTADRLVRARAIESWALGLLQALHALQPGAEASGSGGLARAASAVSRFFGGRPRREQIRGAASSSTEALLPAANRGRAPGQPGGR
jgi:hypothetical protein